MASITSSDQNSDLIALSAGNGKSVILTKEQIRTYFLGSSAPNAYVDTITWAINQIVSGLGNDMIDASEILFDFDPTTGSPITLSIGNFGG